MNVLFGRYKMVPAEVKGLAYGLYGKTPAPMDKKVQKIILKGYERGEEPTTKRPGEILEPEWDKAVADTKGLAKNDGDVLIYALYPTTGSRFLKWKYGLEPVPAEVKGKTLEQIKLEDEVYTHHQGQEALRQGQGVSRQPGEDRPRPRAPGLRTFNVFVDGAYYEVEVECTSGAPVITAVAPAGRGSRPAAAQAGCSPGPGRRAQTRRRARGRARRRPGRRRSAAPRPHARHDHQLQRQGGR